jgi:nucleotide-binding universal stress UspA family protein
LSDDTTSQVSAEITAYAKALMTKSVAAARESATLQGIHTAVHEGDPIKYLLRRSQDAALIVLGTKSHSSISGAIMQSVSQTVAAHAHCATVIVSAEPPSAQPAPRPAIVVGVSPSPGGMAALRYAFAEASRRRIAVEALRSWGDVEWNATALGYSAALFQDLEALETQTMQRCVDEVRSGFGEVEVSTQVSRIRAPWALQQQAAGARLLVVGCHRPDDHWISRLGPVASWLLHHSPCPIAVVGRPSPAEAAPRGTEEPARTVTAIV